MAAAAVSVTTVPDVNAFEHVLPQLMPLGELVTVPVPVPALMTVSVWVPPRLANVANTVRSAVIATVQVVLVPLHAPPQLAKREPVAGVARSVTLVPDTNCPAHVDPQLIPAGVLVTVPVPVPLLVTVSFLLRKVAVAFTSAPRVNVQVRAVPHPVIPIHPVNVEPVAAVAVSVTDVFRVKFALHLVPQLIYPPASSSRCRRPIRPS